jgi:DmsE family decaheme c-type cytochrome
MHKPPPSIAALPFWFVFAVGLAASAAEPASPAAATTAAPAGYLASDYTEKGADTCIRCHDEDSEFPVFSIFKTKHAVRADPRTPFAGLQCESCHGPGAKHAEKIPPGSGKKRPLVVNFGPKSAFPVAKQNAMCLQCHENSHRIAWRGSPHERADVPCADCHKIHAAHDPVLAKDTQPGVCYTCHLKVRADFNKPSTHPVRFGSLTCTDCHQPHGAVAATTALLTRPTVNQTCYTCHAEKRGPFLWEHAPVAEDCTLCHTPHGSIFPALLVKRPPLLCQQCHSQAGHPSVPRTSAGLAGGGNPSAFLLAGGCINCHSQVHGSNSPSGVKLMR